MELQFEKMHGAGNDFILFHQKDLPELPLEVLARAVCHRHFGVGADGMMIAAPSEAADVRMIFYNSDGSEAEMCGNGIRCFARFVHESGRLDQRSFTVETGAGVLTAEIVKAEPAQYAVRISMGRPEMSPQAIPALWDGRDMLEAVLVADNVTYHVSALRMGVPHTIIWQAKDSELSVPSVGPAIEQHDCFPERTNVNFVQVVSPSRLSVRTWERGAGETLACGTGACASAYAAYKKDMINANVRVDVPGGVLEIDINDDGEIFMSGPAERIATGTFIFPGKQKVSE